MTRTPPTQQRALGLSGSSISSVRRVLGAPKSLARLSDHIRKSLVLARKPGQARQDGVGEELPGRADKPQQGQLREGRLVRPV